MRPLFLLPFAIAMDGAICYNAPVSRDSRQTIPEKPLTRKAHNMSKETRKPIESGADIIEWAKQTREGKGEMYTSFNKKEQLLIAEFILGMDEYIKKGVQDTPPAEPSEIEEVVEPNPETEEIVPDKADPDVSLCDVPAVAKEEPVPMTNAEYFRQQKTGVRVAFDVFKRRLEVDPDRYGIFDGGKIMVGASFAYWLNMTKD